MSRFTREETLNAIHLHDVLLAKMPLASSLSSPAERLKEFQSVVKCADEAIDTLAGKVRGRQFVKYLAGLGLTVAGATAMTLGSVSVPVVAAGFAALMTGGVAAIYNTASIAYTRLKQKSGMIFLRSIKECAQGHSDDCIAQNLSALLRTPHLKEDFFDRFPGLEERFSTVAASKAKADVAEAIRQNRLNATL